MFHFTDRTKNNSNSNAKDSADHNNDNLTDQELEELERHFTSRSKREGHF